MSCYEGCHLLIAHPILRSDAKIAIKLLNLFMTIQIDLNCTGCEWKEMFDRWGS